MKTKYYIILLLLFIILFTWCKARINLKSVDENGEIIISKFSHIVQNPRSRDYFFEFYYNFKKTKDYVKEVPDGFQKNLGKFYRIKYLDKYPDLIIVKFEEEVTDTTEILNAGFSKEDL